MCCGSKRNNINNMLVNSPATAALEDWLLHSRRKRGVDQSRRQLLQTPRDQKNEVPFDFPEIVWATISLETEHSKQKKGHPPGALSTRAGENDYPPPSRTGMIINQSDERRPRAHHHTGLVRCRSFENFDTLLYPSSQGEVC
jgi:hypothetical protein